MPPQSPRGAQSLPRHNAGGPASRRWQEFHRLLVYLKRFCELHALFAHLDVTGDGRLSLAEFEAALPTLASPRWGVAVAQPRAEFEAMDEDGGGYVRFDEFCHWAVARTAGLFRDVEASLFT